MALESHLESADRKIMTKAKPCNNFSGTSTLTGQPIVCTLIKNHSNDYHWNRDKKVSWE